MTRAMAKPPTGWLGIFEPKSQPGVLYALSRIDLAQMGMGNHLIDKPVTVCRLSIHWQWHRMARNMISWAMLKTIHYRTTWRIYRYRVGKSVPKCDKCQRWTWATGCFTLFNTKRRHVQTTPTLLLPRDVETRRLRGGSEAELGLCRTIPWTGQQNFNNYRVRRLLLDQKKIQIQVK